MRLHRWRFVNGLMLAGVLGWTAACDQAAPDSRPHVGGASETNPASKSEADASNGPSDSGRSNERSAAPESEIPFAKLEGQWVRPDGGYTITIKSADADGKLDAAYTNPNPLPFATAQASRDGTTLKLFFEIRAGGYNGSTYTLSYDPAADTLHGVYFQAVAQQKFDVYFERMKR